MVLTLFAALALAASAAPVAAAGMPRSRLSGAQPIDIEAQLACDSWKRMDAFCVRVPTRAR